MHIIALIAAAAVAIVRILAVYRLSTTALIAARPEDIPAIVAALTQPARNSSTTKFWNRLRAAAPGRTRSGISRA